MNDFKISTNFLASEVLPPEFFNNPKINPAWYITPFFAVVPQKLRDHFGKVVTINNYKLGLRYRGLRSAACKEFKPFSMHSFGMAIDISIEGLTPQEILDEVKKNRDKFPEITAYEAISYTKTWNHFDCRVTNQVDLFEVNPS